MGVGKLIDKMGNTSACCKQLCFARADCQNPWQWPHYFLTHWFLLYNRNQMTKKNNDHWSLAFLWIFSSQVDSSATETFVSDFPKQKKEEMCFFSVSLEGQCNVRHVRQMNPTDSGGRGGGEWWKQHQAGVTTDALICVFVTTAWMWKSQRELHFMETMQMRPTCISLQPSILHRFIP